MTATTTTRRDGPRCGTARPVPPWLRRTAYGVAVAWGLVTLLSFPLGRMGFHGPQEWAEFYAASVLVPMALLGYVATRSYGLRTRFGKAVALLTGGGLVWALGDLVFRWYLTCEEWPVLACTERPPQPYPSLADAGYLIGPAAWCFACLLLWRAVGIGRAELRSFAWLPAVALGIGTVIAAPTVVHVAGVPLGFDAVFHGGYGPGQVAFTWLYILLDATLLSATVLLWIRSAGFAPYRFVASATASLYVADLVYNAHASSGTYDVHTDLSDVLYALTLLLMLVALASFERAAHAAQVVRREALRLADELPTRTDGAEDGTEER